MRWQKVLDVNEGFSPPCTSVWVWLPGCRRGCCPSGARVSGFQTRTWPLVCLHPLALEGQPSQHLVIKRDPGVLVMHGKDSKDASSRRFVHRGILITLLSPFLGQGERLDELHVDLQGLADLSSNFPFHFVTMRY